MTGHSRVRVAQALVPIGGPLTSSGCEHCDPYRIAHPIVVDVWSLAVREDERSQMLGTFPNAKSVDQPPGAVRWRGGE